MTTITINNTEYKIKYSIRALFIYEQIKGTEFKIETTLDQFVFFYCLLLANNKDCHLTFDDFIDAIDTDPTITEQLNKIAFNNDDDKFYKEEGNGEKKKV